MEPNWLDTYWHGIKEEFLLKHKDCLYGSSWLAWKRKSKLLSHDVFMCPFFPLSFTDKQTYMKYLQCFHSKDKFSGFLNVILHCSSDCFWYLQVTTAENKAEWTGQDACSEKELFQKPLKNAWEQNLLFVCFQKRYWEIMVNADTFSVYLELNSFSPSTAISRLGS